MVASVVATAESVPALAAQTAPKRRRSWGDQPQWKRKLILQTLFLWLLLIAHAGFLYWTRRYDPNVSSFWGQFGFDQLGIATDCGILRQQQLAWTLAVNVLATLITYVSSDVILALCAPTRRQLDASHANRQYLDVGVYSFRNIRSPHFGWKKRILWVFLTLLILPFHLIYNSVIILSQPASESYQISVPNSLFQSGDSAASSVSIIDGAATRTPLPVSIAATMTPGNLNAGAIPTATSIAAITAAASSSPTACVGPSTIVQESPSQATVQPHIDRNCNSFAVAPCGMGCQDFLTELKVSLSEFLAWNPDIGITKQNTCQNFFGGYAYCVGISSGTSDRRVRSSLPLARRDPASPLQIDEAEVAASIELLEPSANFQSLHPKSTYNTSPFLYFNSSDPNDWVGLHEATEDLNNLLSFAYFNDTQQNFNNLVVDSSDWLNLSLSDCRSQFSELYRPNTGTVVLVVSGLDTTESVVGLSYLSYDWTDLMVSCPTSFLQQTNDGTSVIIDENPPVLPLMFGTFQGKQANNPNVNPKHIFNETKGSYFVCPQSYPGSDYQPSTQPIVEGCLLKSRSSVCRMGVNILFTVILLVALTMKAVFMTLALFVLEDEPILTIGDAMAEYLERPDPLMANTSFSWNESDGWKVIDGPIMAYQHGRSRGTDQERVEKKWKDGCLSWLLSWPGRQWRKVWGYADMGRTEVVPKSDIFNNLHTMRSADSVVWFWSYMCTLGVCFGIFYSIGSQNGWTVFPTGNADLWWMLWPTILCNLPQLFATIRGFTDTRILTSRSGLEDFATYATQRKGLRVSTPQKNTAQHPVYFFGGMNALVFATTTGLQTLYAWIISEFAQPQWVNPLRPSDPSDFVNPAFLMKFGADANRTLAGNICFGLLIVLFPFLAVYIVNITQSLVIRVRTLRVGELSTFIPQWLADVFLLRWVARWGRPEKTAHLLPLVPLQMPGPATNSLVIALVCQPQASERKPGLSLEPLQWGVVQMPTQQQQLKASSAVDEEKLARIKSSSTLSSSTTPVLTSSAPIRASVSRKPVAVPVRSMSPVSDEIEPAMSPTMNGAPHLSGDEAAFANAWFDLVGVPPGEQPTTQQLEQIHAQQQQHGYFGALAHAPPSTADYDVRGPRQGYYAVSPSQSPAFDAEKGFATINEQVVEATPPRSLPVDTDEGWTAGHCAFSAQPVAELEPGRFYTGIRHGEGSLTWRQQLVEVTRDFLRALLFVEFPDEHGHSRHRTGPQYLGEIGDRASHFIAGLPHGFPHRHDQSHGYNSGYDYGHVQGHGQSEYGHGSGREQSEHGHGQSDYGYGQSEHGHVQSESGHVSGHNEQHGYEHMYGQHGNGYQYQGHNEYHGQQ